MKNKNRAVIVLIVVACLLAGGVTWVLAQAASIEGVINACQRKDNTIQISSNGTCKKGETPLSWPNAAVLQTEATTRAAADTDLQNSIATEVTDRSAADATEVTARESADAALQVQNEAEAAARATADTALDERLSVLEARVASLEATVAAQQAVLDTLLSPEPKTVFVSSATYDGNLGGLDGADAKCQALADAASLSGTYKAWLSDSTGSPSTRFARSTTPYVRTDGATVAYGWADLTDGTLFNAIVYDELKQGYGNLFVWTDTLRNGTITSPETCSDWTSGAPGSASWAGFANPAYPERWTDWLHNSCTTQGHLYCFQQ